MAKIFCIECGEAVLEAIGAKKADLVEERDARLFVD
jgi:hypothetical protein